MCDIIEVWGMFIGELLIPQSVVTLLSVTPIATKSGSCPGNYIFIKLSKGYQITRKLCLIKTYTHQQRTDTKQCNGINMAVNKTTWIKSGFQTTPN